MSFLSDYNLNFLSLESTFLVDYKSKSYIKMLLQDIIGIGSPVSCTVLFRNRDVLLDYTALSTSGQDESVKLSDVQATNKKAVSNFGHSLDFLNYFYENALFIYIVTLNPAYTKQALYNKYDHRTGITVFKAVGL